MRILYFSNSCSTHDRRFLARFVEAGFETFFLRLGAGSALEQRPPPSTVHLLDWPGENMLARTISDVAPDVVFAGPVPNCGYLAALAKFRPLVVMSWGFDLLLDRPGDDSHITKIRTALDAASLFVCDCQAVLRKAEAIAGRAIPSVFIIPWGTGLAAFQPACPKPAPPNKPEWQHEFVVFSNRGWTPVHGVRTALEAFYQAWVGNPRFRLVLAGDGPEADFVHAFIEDHGMASVVWTPGFVDPSGLPAWYQGADAYLSCSSVDGTSVSMLEALACGLPVVVSDIEGNREWIEHGKNGWLAAASSPDAFSKRLLEIASTPAQARIRVSMEARRTVEKRADWQRNSIHLIEALESLVPTPRKLA